jgi:dolichyldiphosphatase
MAQEHDPWKRPWWLAFLDKVSFNFCASGNILIRFNHFLAFETNLTVVGLTACYLAYTRSAGVAYFGAGAVMCSLTVKILKRILRQPRPVHKNGSHRKLTYGSVRSYFDFYIISDPFLL